MHIRMVITVPDNQKELIRSLLSYSSLGLEMGFCVVIGLVTGHYLDRYLGTDPYLTVVFMTFGIIAAFRAVYSAYKRLKKDNEGDNDI